MKQDQDLRNIITSHQAEMTELELDIARYFLSPEAQQHSLSSSIVSLSTTLTKKLNQKN